MVQATEQVDLSNPHKQKLTPPCVPVSRISSGKWIFLRKCTNQTNHLKALKYHFPLLKTTHFPIYLGENSPILKPIRPNGPIFLLVSDPKGPTVTFRSRSSPYSSIFLPMPWGYQSPAGIWRRIFLGGKNSFSGFCNVVICWCFFLKR